MPEDHIRYDLLAQAALRGVVRTVLADAAKNGLPGEHHFKITFATDAPGVALSERMRQQYPQVMTIVLQHQFWDLGFDRETETVKVGLSFGGVPAKLGIPLSAIVEFADPHIRYGLRFQPDEPAAEDTPAEEPEQAAALLGPPPSTEEAEQPEQGQVVSLDAFRRRSPQ